MKKLVYIVVGVIAVMVGYTVMGNLWDNRRTSEKTAEKEGEEDSVCRVSIFNDVEEDKTLDTFKVKYPDEWRVVEQCIDYQQRNEGNIDNAWLDKLVRGYISKKNISLPKDEYQQIIKIEEICKQKFNIHGYDYTNWGMHIAADVEITFEEYVNWLLVNKVKRHNNSGINIIEEEKYLTGVIDAYYNCCDKIINAFDGSGGWMFSYDVYSSGIEYKKSIYLAILRPQMHNKIPSLLTAKQFREACDKAIASFSPNDYSENAPTPQEVRLLYDTYYKAIAQWLEHRNKTEERISDQRLKSEYNYITMTFAHEHLTHIKKNLIDV